MAKRSVSAVITGANEFTAWFSFRPANPGTKYPAGLRIGDNTSFDATVTIQTKEPDEETADAADIATYTAATRKTLEFAHACDVRVGVKTGDYTSGTIPVSISE